MHNKKHPLGCSLGYIFNFSVLNGKTEIIISTYRGEFAYPGRGSVPALGTAKIYLNGKYADIFITFRIENYVAGDSNDFYVFSYDFLKQLCQNKEVDWNTASTNVQILNITQDVIYEHYFGRTGLLFEVNKSDNSVKFSRALEGTLATGGWPSSETNLYKKGLFATVNIYGATIS